MISKIPISMGPTASGKTGLAIDLARSLDGEIINADSMQVYADLRTITARPSREEEAGAPHHLFGFLPASQICNAQHWADLAQAKIAEIQTRGKRPIIVGGTGFYIRALTQGLDEIPSIDTAIRAEVRALSTPQAYEALSQEDPDMSAGFAPADGQRVRRALEVYRQTGQSLAQFQSGGASSDDRRFEIFKLLPDRQDLYDRCNLRLELMWEDAKEEVAAYLEQSPGADWPLTKAIGVPEISAVLNGELDEEQGLTLAQQKTRNYAKRQLTWLRNQHSEAKLITMTYQDLKPQDSALGLMLEKLHAQP